MNDNELRPEVFAFVRLMIARTGNGEQTTALFPREVEKIEQLHDKHFA